MIPPFLFGQDTEQRVGMTGWIGDSPHGPEYPFLLVHPYADNVSQKMRTLAQHIGMSRSTEPMSEIDSATVRISDGPVVHIDPIHMLHRAVPTDWADLARARGQVVLILGEYGFQQSKARPVASIDRYLERGRGIWAALLTVAP